jgi:hypothetical protein
MRMRREAFSFIFSAENLKKNKFAAATELSRAAVSHALHAKNLTVRE